MFPAAHYLEDAELTIDGVRFYGSPWQPAFADWAFNLPRGPGARRGVGPDPARNRRPRSRTAHPMASVIARPSRAARGAPDLRSAWPKSRHGFTVRSHPQTAARGATARRRPRKRHDVGVRTRADRGRPRAPARNALPVTIPPRGRRDDRSSPRLDTQVVGDRSHEPGATRAALPLAPRWSWRPSVIEIVPVRA